MGGGGEGKALQRGFRVEQNCCWEGRQLLGDLLTHRKGDTPFAMKAGNGECILQCSEIAPALAKAKEQCGSYAQTPLQAKTRPILAQRKYCMLYAWVSATGRSVGLKGGEQAGYNKCNCNHCRRSRARMRPSAARIRIRRTSTTTPLQICEIRHLLLASPQP